MGTTTETPAGIETSPAERLLERLTEGALGGLDVLAAAIGDRLGFYRALDGAPMTADQLATLTGAAPRYTREWLEQQAMAGLVEPDGAAFRLAPGVADVLARPGTLLFAAPFMRQVAAAAAFWAHVADAVAQGHGFPWSEFGADMYQSQADSNEAMFRLLLADTWLPAALPEVHARLDSGDALAVAEIGCGGGWASIAVADRFPAARVHGYDVDAPTVDLARRNVATAGLADRVEVRHHDVGSRVPEERYDLVMAFECIHDMPAPVDVLRGMRRMLGPGGRVLVADMAGAETFVPDGDPLQRLLYGFSILVCLPDAMSGNPEGATGTVMRPTTMDRYAREAGFTAAVPLGVEHDLWRFYELTT